MVRMVLLVRIMLEQKKLKNLKGFVMSDNLVWGAVFMGIALIIGIYVIATIGGSLGATSYATAGYNSTVGNVTSGFAQASALFPVVFIILMIVLVVAAVMIMRGGKGPGQSGGM